MTKGYTATKVREISPKSTIVSSLSGQIVWRVDGPGPRPHHVLTSAATVVCSGQETYVFLCDESGKVSNWLELDGSIRGVLDHQAATDGYIEHLNSEESS